MPRALILGATGQDSQFLADFLLSKDYEVLGISRSFEPFPSNPLSLRRPLFSKTDIRSRKDLARILDDFQPDEVYNLSGESSVSRSFQNPTETVESNVLGVVNLLTTILQNPTLKDTRVFQASSAEMFGSSSSQLNELSPFNPVSPYGISKLAAHDISSTFRETFDLWISCGILFNHESEIRPASFVFQKIIASAVSVSLGRLDKLTLGNLEITRDWGYSRDYVEAMWQLLQADKPDDFVIATGEKHSLKQLVEKVFGVLGINSEIEDLVRVDLSTARPIDISCTWGDPEKIRHELGWRAPTDFSSLVEKMIEFQIKLQTN